METWVVTLKSILRFAVSMLALFVVILLLLSIVLHDPLGVSTGLNTLLGQFSQAGFVGFLGFMLVCYFSVKVLKKPDS